MRPFFRKILIIFTLIPTIGMGCQSNSASDNDSTADSNRADSDSATHTTGNNSEKSDTSSNAETDSASNPSTDPDSDTDSNPHTDSHFSTDTISDTDSVNDSDTLDIGDTDTTGDDTGSNVHVDTDTQTETDIPLDTDTVRNCFEGDYIIEDSQDVQELAAYSCVTGCLEIVDTPLTSITLPHLDVEWDILVENNVALTTLDLSGVTASQSHLTIRSNPALTHLDMSNLATIDGFMSVTQNASLQNLDGFKRLSSVGVRWTEGVSIGSNDSLMSVSGLASLEVVGGDLRIYANPLLTNLAGLEKLSRIASSLVIEDNDALSTLDGLDNLTTLSFITIQSNPNLPQCEVCQQVEQLIDFTDWGLSSYDNQPDTCTDTCQ